MSPMESQMSFQEESEKVKVQDETTEADVGVICFEDARRDNKTKLSANRNWKRLGSTFGLRPPERMKTCHYFEFKHLNSEERVPDSLLPQK